LIAERSGVSHFPIDVVSRLRAKRDGMPRIYRAGREPVMMRRTHSSLLKELDVDPQVRAEQMGHTVDVNENVYTITSLKRRKEAVNALEKAVGA
jgi:integrase